MALTGISSGKIKKPYLILLYGPDGAGKSTFAADAPNPIFVGAEDGSGNLNVSRFSDINTWSDIKSKVKQLLTEKHDFKTCVIDSLDWAEPLMYKELSPNGPIEDIAGGYGKWVGVVVNEWQVLMSDLLQLRAKGMNIILIAHSHIKAFNDPSHPLPYDRYQLKLQEKSAAKWREFVDAVLFANFDMVAFKVNKSDRKIKTTETGKRLIYTVRNAAYDAKNRLGLPAVLPLSFAAFDEAANAGNPDSIENIKNDLMELSKQLDDVTKTKMLAAVEKAGNNAITLSKILNHTRVLVKDE